MAESDRVADLLTHQRKSVRIILGDEVPASIDVNVPPGATLGMVLFMALVPSVIRVFVEPVRTIFDTYVFISATMVYVGMNIRRFDVVLVITVEGLMDIVAQLALGKVDVAVSSSERIIVGVPVDSGSYANSQTNSKRAR
jgi:hypothetical protein